MSERERSVLNVWECVLFLLPFERCQLICLPLLIVSVGVGPPPGQNKATDPEVKR